MRDTSVVIVTLDTGEVYVIVSLSSRIDTQVIYIDPTTGALRYNAKVGFDVFRSENEALDNIANGSRCRKTYARAILGYATLGSFGMLLVATKLTASIPNLPGGGCILTVAESQWIKIPLQNPQNQGKGEVKNVQELTDLDIDGKHYFCETRDITRPFPSHMSFHEPDDEFVWNGWFSMPFKDVGLPQHCVILLQVLHSSYPHSLSHSFSNVYCPGLSPFNVNTRCSCLCMICSSYLLHNCIWIYLHKDFEVYDDLT